MSSIRHQRGMTLMELMVVIVVIGILAAIAYPGYRQQVLRTNRSQCQDGADADSSEPRALLYAHQHLCRVRGTAIHDT